MLFIIGGMSGALVGLVRVECRADPDGANLKQRQFENALRVLSDSELSAKIVLHQRSAGLQIVHIFLREPLRTKGVPDESTLWYVSENQYSSDMLDGKKRIYPSVHDFLLKADNAIGLPSIQWAWWEARLVIVAVWSVLGAGVVGVVLPWLISQCRTVSCIDGGDLSSVTVSAVECHSSAVLAVGHVDERMQNNGSGCVEMSIVGCQATQVESRSLETSLLENKSRVVGDNVVQTKKFGASGDGYYPTELHKDDGRDT